MIITMCGSMKFAEEMRKLQKRLEEQGHTIEMPVEVPGVDYWAPDGEERSKAKAQLNLVAEHFRRIEGSDAILVANYSKPDAEHYIGANTFGEILFAHYLEKHIYLLNPLPAQPYILDELLAIAPVIINGDLQKIPSDRDDCGENKITIPM